MTARSSLPVIAAAVLVWGPASADEVPMASWWIEAEPSCLPSPAELVDRVQFACDAAGGPCRVVGPNESAGHRAVLACGDDERAPWRLKGETRSGVPLFAMTIDGDPEQRLRQVAVEIARTSAPAPSAEPRLEPALTCDACTKRRMRPSALGLSLSSLLGTQNGRSGMDPYGARLAAVVEVARAPRHPEWGGMKLGVSASCDQGRNLLGQAEEHTGGRFGALVGWGAPWNERVFGAYGEVGGAWAYDTWSYGAGRVQPKRAQVSPYFQGSIVLQLPTHAPLRSWLGLSVGVRTSLYDEVSEYWTFDAGIAWLAL